MDTGSRQVAFMPWLRLNRAYRIAGVDFVSWRTATGAVPPELSGTEEPVGRILKGYIDREGQAIDNCVVATIPGHGWNLTDSDFDVVRSAAELLFLAVWSSNEYYPRFTGPYSNSSAFRLVWQRFSGQSEGISLVSRRRDGRTVVGGYKHGEVKFSIPLQCSGPNSATVDEPFLTALDACHAKACNTVVRLRSALAFVQLANTDDDLMAETAEAILMASAFEQLLGGNGTAYKLSRKFGVLFYTCGSVAVQDAQKVRKGIEIDTSTPERAAAQSKWWVHRKWIEELYNVRSKSVHKGAAHMETCGWHPTEHLVMAAWVFPMAVKCSLQRDGHYTITDDDRARCLTVDKLLATTGWAEDDGYGSKWSQIVSETREHHLLEIAIQNTLEQNPHLLQDDASQPSGQST